MTAQNLPIDILRSFITVIDLDGYTRAANLLGRSQPAISLQIRKLEQLLDCKLIVHVGRKMQLTEDGKALAVLARQILQLNDQAVGRLERSQFTGPIKVGLPVDYSVGFLQEKLTEFITGHSDQTIEVHCGLSSDLLDGLNSGDIDIAVLLFSGGDHQYLFRQWREQPVWVASKGWKNEDSGDVIPLVTHPEGCEYRKRMITSLAESRREWRVAYSSPGIGGVQKAVLDGLGVSALTKRTISSGMKTLDHEDGFLPMEELHIGLFYRLARLKGAGQDVVEYLAECLDSDIPGTS